LNILFEPIFVKFRTSAGEKLERFHATRKCKVVEVVDCGSQSTARQIGAENAVTGWFFGKVRRWGKFTVYG
jgi:hypothetical protein